MTPHTRALVIASLLAVCLACGAPDQSRPNILLVSIDTLRADHLGCYGYGRDTSPHLDRLAARSRRYSNAFAPTPWTLPSHAALLTGMHPASLGIVGEGGAISRGQPLLAELVSGVGYQTAAFVDSSDEGFVGAARGFGRGFDVYRHAPHTDASRAAWRHDISASVDVLLDWVDQRDTNRPFFAFLHTKSVHNTPSEAGFNTRSDSPYDMPEPYLSRFLPEGRMQFDWKQGDFAGSAYLYLLNNKIRDGASEAELLSRAELDELIAMYDAGIYWVDEQIGRLLSGLEARGLDENTVVVITSDHGEAFGEHRFFLHKEVFDSQLRVPLIVHDPRAREPVVVDAPVTLMDVVPTLLYFSRVAIPSTSDGVRLPMPEAVRQGSAQQESAAPADRSLFAYRRFRENDAYRGFSLREGRWKLVLHGDPESSMSETFFDWQSDPTESTPASPSDAVREGMTERLREQMRAINATSSGEEITLSPKTRRELEALGYAQ